MAQPLDVSHWARTPNKVWFFGYTAKHQKIGDYPFDPTAIKQNKISNSESVTLTKPSNSVTTSTPQDGFESSQVESSAPSAVSFSEDQINCSKEDVTMSMTCTMTKCM